MPFYNSDLKLLEFAVKSVLNQTIKNIELIIVNDGSNVKNFEQILAAAKTDKRIKIITQKHKGAGIARNLGIENASGDFIAFMDADDYYPDNEVLEHLYNTALNSNVLISGGKVLMDNDGELSQPFWHFKNIENLYCNRTVDYKDFQICWGYWCYIYKKQLITDNNIYFPDYLRYQDPPWFIRMLNTAKTFYTTDKVSYIYRNSTEAKKWSNRQIKDYFKGIENVLLYSKQEGLNELHAFIYRKFLTYDIKILNSFKMNLLLDKNRIINDIFRATNENIIEKIEPEVPIFKDVKDYKQNIAKYDLIDK